MSDGPKEKLRIIGMYQLKQKKYVHLGFTDKWKKSYGDATEGFQAIFFGDSGSCKTEGAVQFAKYLIQFGNVLYLSYEQEDRSTIRTAFERNGLLEMNKKAFLSPGGSFDTVVNYLKQPKSPHSVFFDSVDYSKLTYEQTRDLRKMFPKKNFIYVAHGRGNYPKTTIGQEIRFDSDMKNHVKKGVVFPDTRFDGGGDPFVVFDKRAREFHPYLFLTVEPPAKMKAKKPKEEKKVKKVKAVKEPKEV